MRLHPVRPAIPNTEYRMAAGRCGVMSAGFGRMFGRATELEACMSWNDRERRAWRNAFREMAEKMGADEYADALYEIIGRNEDALEAAGNVESLEWYRAQRQRRQQGHD